MLEWGRREDSAHSLPAERSVVDLMVLIMSEHIIRLLKVMPMLFFGARMLKRAFSETSNKGMANQRRNSDRKKKKKKRESSQADLASM